MWFGEYTLPVNFAYFFSRFDILSFKFIFFLPTSHTAPSSLCNLSGQFSFPPSFSCVLSAATRDSLLPTAVYHERGCTFQSVTLHHYVAPSSRGLVLSLAGCYGFTVFASCSLSLYLFFLLDCFLLPQPEGLPLAKSSNTAPHPQHSFLL